LPVKYNKNLNLMFNDIMNKLLLYLMAVLYVFAGINHFINPKTYVRIMPRFLPWHLQLVYLSGVLEIVFGIMLLFSSTRVMAAWLIILLLIVIFPANIQMAVDYYHLKKSHFWITMLRLPLQFVLIWWAWLYTKTPSFN